MRIVDILCAFTKHTFLHISKYEIKCIRCTYIFSVVTLMILKITIPDNFATTPYE